MDRGRGRGMIGRGGLPMLPKPPVVPSTPVDVMMPDVASSKPSEDANGDTEMMDAPKGTEKEKYEEREPEPTPPPPVEQKDDVMVEDEEEEDVLTQEDVLAKINSITEEVKRKEARLEELAKKKAVHQAAIDAIDAGSVQTGEHDDEQDVDADQDENSQRMALSSPIVPAHPTEAVLPSLRVENGHSVTPSLSPSVSETASDVSATGSSETASIETESDAEMDRDSKPVLPYLQSRKKAIKLFDQDIYKEALSTHEQIQDAIMEGLITHRKEVFAKENDLKRKFNEYYDEWSERCALLDATSTRKRKGGSGEPIEHRDRSPLPPVQGAEPSGTTRRRGGAAVGDVVRSEAEMEQVLRDLREQEEAADALAKLDGPKEAEVPNMIIDTHDQLHFQDTNRLLRTREEILTAYNYYKPADDWTPEEQEVFIEAYINNPKQWYKIAAEVKTRDTKACILHYYMTKKAEKYKERMNRGKRRKRRGRTQGEKNRTRQAALMADLGKGNTTPGGAAGEGEENAEGGDGDTPQPPQTPQVTERGRPKRAAAPVFGQKDEKKEEKEEAETPAPPTGRRAAKEKAAAEKAEKEKEKAEKAAAASTAASANGDDGTPDVEKPSTPAPSKSGKRTRGTNTAGRKEAAKRVRTPATPAPQQPLQAAPPHQHQPPPLAPAIPGVHVGGKQKPPALKDDLSNRESDAASVLATLSATREEVSQPILMPAGPISGTTIHMPHMTPLIYQQQQQQPMIHAQWDMKHQHQQQIQPQIMQQGSTPVQIVPQQQPSTPGTPQGVSTPKTQTPRKRGGTTSSVAGSEGAAGATSSYWSVTEQNEFPQLLKSYGSNWGAISQRLASKTTTMV